VMAGLAHAARSCARQSWPRHDSPRQAADTDAPSRGRRAGFPGCHPAVNRASVSCGVHCTAAADYAGK
jgi:hypothetical protein